MNTDENAAVAINTHAPDLVSVDRDCRDERSVWRQHLHAAIFEVTDQEVARAVNGKTGRVIEMSCGASWFAAEFAAKRTDCVEDLHVGQMRQARH